MRILALGDFHGIVPFNVNKLVEDYSIDLILCTGDFASSGRITWKYWKRLMAGEKLKDVVGMKVLKKDVALQVEKEKRVMKALKGLSVPMVMVYGNCDLQRSYLKEIGIKALPIDDLVKSESKIKLVKSGMYKFKGLKIVCYSGYRGYSAKKGSTTPERARKNRKWEKDMTALAKNAKGNFILLTHDVPFGKLDMVKDRKSPVFSEHVGEKLFLDFDKKYQPMIHVCGHMHENQGTDRIGKTLVVNPGFGGVGQSAIIDIENKISVRFIR